MEEHLRWVFNKAAERAAHYGIQVPISSCSVSLIHRNHFRMQCWSSACLSTQLFDSGVRHTR